MIDLPNEGFFPYLGGVLNEDSCEQSVKTICYGFITFFRIVVCVRLGGGGERETYSQRLCTRKG